jgi:hypothetical protein
MAIAPASPEFVALVKKRLRDRVLESVAQEKEKGGEATIEDEECPICNEPLGPTAVVTAPCIHFFCKGAYFHGFEVHLR